jgi:hypothetical protein
MEHLLDEGSSSHNWGRHNSQRDLPQGGFLPSFLFLSLCHALTLCLFPDLDQKALYHLL